MGNQKEIKAPSERMSSYEIHGYPGKELPESYVRYVKARWKNSLRNGNGYIKLIDIGAYQQNYWVYLTSICQRPEVLIRLAVLSDDFDVALGFSVIERDVLHYVYVQKDFRRQGIGKSLIPCPINSFTHITDKTITLWSMKLPKAIFNPWQ